jgi:hypothetical protein
VVQFVHEIRELDPGMGSDNLWHIYKNRFSDDYRIGRDAFRSILHERGLNIRQRHRAVRTTDSRHNLPVYPDLVKNVIPIRPTISGSATSPIFRLRTPVPAWVIVSVS